MWCHSSVLCARRLSYRMVRHAQVPEKSHRTVLSTSFSYAIRGVASVCHIGYWNVVGNCVAGALFLFHDRALGAAGCCCVGCALVVW